MFSVGLSSGLAGGRCNKLIFDWHLQLASCVPAGLIKREHGVSAWGDTPADLLEVKLHGRGIGARKDERGASVARRTNRAKHIGIGVTLILSKRSCGRTALMA